MADPLNIAQPLNSDFVKFGADELRTIKTLLTGAYAGFLTAPNAVALKAKTAAGVATDILKITAADLCEVGNAALPLKLLGSSLQFAGANINADLLDGLDSVYFLNSANQNAGILPAARLAGAYTITASAATLAADSSLLNGQNGAFYQNSGNQNAGFLPIARIADASVTNAKLADLAQALVHGRAAGAGTGPISGLTAAQLITILTAADGAGSLLDADLLDGLNTAAVETVSTVMTRDAAGRSRVVDPIAAQDIATKAYADSLVTTTSSGTFAPVIVGTTAAGVGTYIGNTGFYRVIGKLCFFTVNLTWSAHTGTGNMRISPGLPFASVNNPGEVAVFPTLYSDLVFSAGNYYSLVARATANSTLVDIFQMGNNVPLLALPMDAAGSLTFSGVYELP